MLCMKKSFLRKEIVKNNEFEKCNTKYGVLVSPPQKITLPDIRKNKNLQEKPNIKTAICPAKIASNCNRKRSLNISKRQLRFDPSLSTKLSSHDSIYKAVNQTSSSFVVPDDCELTFPETHTMAVELMPPKTQNRTITQSKFQSKVGSIDDYEIEEMIGKGAYGEVYTATAINTGKKYAIKVYDKYQMGEQHKIKSVSNEIRILKRLDHPNLIKLYSVHETPSKIFLVMELVKGITLTEYLKNKRTLRLEELECKKIFKQIIEGVDYIHSKSICHRDIKLENILITESGMIKILDFGFAVKYNSHKKLSTYCGTPNYMAPELIVKVPYDPNKMEVWSCGICLYKLLTGKFPFTGRNDEDLKKQLQETEVEYPEYLSEKAIEILKKMLCKDQFERATTTEVLIDKWLYELCLKPEIKIKPKKKVKEEHKPSKLTGKDFMLDKSISKFALDDKIVKNILKLGYTEEFIHNEVENEESYIGKLYRKLYELKKQLMK